MENLVTLPPINLKNSLLSHGVYELINAKIIEEVKKIPNYLQLKLNPELTALISSLVEHSTTKDQKIDKKKLVIQVLQTIFSLTAPEVIIVGQQIEFLLDNKLVKRAKKKYLKKAYNLMVNLSSGKLSTKKKN